MSHGAKCTKQLRIYSRNVLGVFPHMSDERKKEKKEKKRKTERKEKKKKRKNRKKKRKKLMNI